MKNLFKILIALTALSTVNSFAQEGLRSCKAGQSVDQDGNYIYRHKDCSTEPLIIKPVQTFNRCVVGEYIRNDDGALEYLRDTCDPRGTNRFKICYCDTFDENGFINGEKAGMVL